MRDGEGTMGRRGYSHQNEMRPPLVKIPVPEGHGAIPFSLGINDDIIDGRISKEGNGQRIKRRLTKFLGDQPIIQILFAFVVIIACILNIELKGWPTPHLPCKTNGIIFADDRGRSIECDDLRATGLQLAQQQTNNGYYEMAFQFYLLFG